MSTDLQWLLLRNNSSFIVKNNGYTFTTEPGNLTQMNTPKYSGLVNKKAIRIEANGKGGSTLYLKAATRKPAGQWTSATTLPSSSAARCAIKTVKGMLKGRFYRQDLQRVAIARALALGAVEKNAKKPMKARKVRGAKKTN